MSSLSFASLSSAVTGKVLNNLGSLGVGLSITYPSEGTVTPAQESNSHYSGPMKNLLIPVAFQIDKNITLDLFGQPIHAFVEERINAVANATYGGELSFNGNDSSNAPVAIPAIIGASTYLASTFFAKKAREHRDERIVRAVGDLNPFVTI